MYKINNNQHDNSMITNYKVNKNELVLNIKLEDFNFKKSNITLFYQLINNLLENINMVIYFNNNPI